MPEEKPEEGRVETTGPPWGVNPSPIILLADKLPKAENG
jgi:hypothetical protein